MSMCLKTANNVGMMNQGTRQKKKKDPKVFMSQKEENSDADTPVPFNERQ